MLRFFRLFLSTILFPILLVIIQDQVFAAKNDFISLGYGLGWYKSDKFEQYNVYPKGGNYSLLYGMRGKKMGFEVLLQKASYNGDLVHESVNYNLEHGQTTFGLGLQFYVTDQFYARVGYAYSKVKQILPSTLSDSLKTEIESIYSIKSNSSRMGPFYGLGFNIFGGKRFDMFSQFTVIHADEDGKDYSLQVGFKIYFDLTIGSILNGR